LKTSESGRVNETNEINETNEMNVAPPESWVVVTVGEKMLLSGASGKPISTAC
jgi:hypothetical protein